MTPVNKVVCPVCHSPNDGSTEIHGEDGSPSDGDLSICYYCGTLAMYVITEETIKVRELTEEETESAMKIPDVKRALAFLSAKHPDRA